MISLAIRSTSSASSTHRTELRSPVAAAPAHTRSTLRRVGGFMEMASADSDTEGVCSMKVFTYTYY